MEVMALLLCFFIQFGHDEVVLHPVQLLLVVSVLKTTPYWLYWSTMPDTLRTESVKKISLVFSIA